MSKAVKSVTRAVSKVVSGVSKVVSSAVKGVSGFAKKIASSKIGRILITAAAIYFGGAAIMGAMGGASAGTGFLGTLSGAIQGAGTGIANAWTSLGAAASSAMGGNFAAAGSQLATGFQGGSLAGGTGITAGATTGLTAPATAGATTGATTGASQYALTTGAGAGTATGTGITAAAAPTAAGAAPASAGLFSSELAKYGAVTGGMQLAGGVIQGYGQQKAMEDQLAYEEEQARQARERADQNMSASFEFGAPGDSPMVGTTPSGLNYAQYNIPTPQYRPVQFTPNQAAPRPQPGLIGGQMGGARPFPIYNPALAPYGYR